MKPIDSEAETARAAALAAKYRLTPEELADLQRAAIQTYQAIGADLHRPISRDDLVEVVLDASYIKLFGFDARNPLTPRLEAILGYGSAKIGVDRPTYRELQDMIRPAFPCAEYE